jgi:hypothetical protein
VPLTADYDGTDKAPMLHGGRVYFLSDRSGQGERDTAVGGSGGSLEPPWPLLTHLRTAYTAYSECLPTRLTPLAERTCFSQAPVS